MINHDVQISSGSGSDQTFETRVRIRLYFENRIRIRILIETLGICHAITTRSKSAYFFRLF